MAGFKIVVLRIKNIFCEKTTALNCTDSRTRYHAGQGTDAFISLRHLQYYYILIGGWASWAWDTGYPQESDMFLDPDHDWKRH